MKRIVVLASGRGSNFQAVIDALIRKEIPAVCTGLLTDNPRAYAVTRANNAGIPVVVIDYSNHATKQEYEEELLVRMKESGADLFVLAGYMRILGKDIIREFSGRIINIHPALLPSFPGLHSQRQAISYGVKVSGCTVHFVEEEMDSGPIITQVCVPVLTDDDESSLAERILKEEHRCLPWVIRLFCEDRLRIEGRRVRIL